MEYIPVPFLKLIYPLKEPNRTRTKDLKVICLGLGRTGTESLRTALYELGYSEVHHGWRLSDPTKKGETPQWLRLALAKYSKSPFVRKPGLLNRTEFDRVLGDCEAVTDLPSAAFALEIIRLYPEAKVVLNRRSSDDLEAWYESQKRTVQNLFPVFSRLWLLSFFDSELFWTARLAKWAVQGPCDWNFEANGRELYRRHYKDLEAECRSQGREWLDWTVTDGWRPLCEFLGKDVPTGKEFPSGNDGAGFAAKRARNWAGRTRRAERNLMITVGAIAGAVVACIGWYYRPRLEVLLKRST